MKKLAIPLDNGSLSHHFGHAPEFRFYQIEDNKIVATDVKNPPAHAEGTIPRWLMAEGVTDLLVGGIGPKAIQILNDANINVYVGVEAGDGDTLANKFVSDDLKFGQNYCHH